MQPYREEKIHVCGKDYVVEVGDTRALLSRFFSTISFGDLTKPGQLRTEEWGNVTTGPMTGKVIQTLDDELKKAEQCRQRTVLDSIFPEEQFPRTNVYLSTIFILFVAVRARFFRLRVSFSGVYMDGACVTFSAGHEVREQLTLSL